MAAGKRKQNYAAREAHRKNMERAKVQEQASKRKAFLKKYRTLLTIGIPALVVLVVGIWLVVKATVGPGGSIPNFFGSLQGVQENWIVTNQGTDKAPRYYRMGAFDAPEGYTLDAEYKISSDKGDRTFYYKADDDSAVIKDIYLTGVRNKKASEMVTTVLNYSMFYGDPVISEEPVAGHEAKWIVGTLNDDETATEESELEIGHKQMTVYIDSVQDACVLALMTTKSAAQEELPSNEEVLAAAEELLSHLTVEH